MATERTAMTPDGDVITFTVNMEAMTPSGAVVGVYDLDAVVAASSPISPGGMIVNVNRLMNT